MYADDLTKGAASRDALLELLGGKVWGEVGHHVYGRRLFPEPFFFLDLFLGGHFAR